jgi:signal transduction histidine kinase
MEALIHNGVYTIRPAGRHIITIGANLIKDKYAAVVELVKNAYDADANEVTVAFFGEKAEGKGVTIEVRDTGDGMSFDKVVNQWMVPSTDDKVRHPVSPKGRTRQGSKGVGRYAASILGKELILETTTPEGELTTLYLIWEDFVRAQYLQDVGILIESVNTDRSKGTSLRLTGDALWTDKEIASLQFELRKLVAPSIDDDEGDKEPEIAREFIIKLEFDESWPGIYSGLKKDIEPFPIIKFYDYRIWGHVDSTGWATLHYHNNRVGDITVTDLDFEIRLPEDPKYDLSYCGPLDVDFRVYDREPQAIQNLIDRGLSDPESGEPIGKRMATNLLNEYHGIGVYRSGFRIRPLGDPGFDWLSLDKRRVQNPSLRIGSNQVIGFTRIASEEESGLQEKSARDGIKEDTAYFGLIEISRQVLNVLENKRFDYRLKAGLGRTQRDIDGKVDSLFRLEDLKRKVERTLLAGGVDSKTQQKIIALIDTQQESNAKTADAIKRIVATYQGQATIGKIVHIILHEGRKPISYFKNAANFISTSANQLARRFDQEQLGEVVERAKGFEEQSNIISGLFSRLDPLAARRGDKKVEFKLAKTIANALAVFESELAKSNITYTVSCDDTLNFYGWAVDFQAALTNLVDNSIYWLNTVDEPRTISIKVAKTDDLLRLEYRDNGPGIPEEYIKSQVIFEPEFTTKTESGSGLGLAIAGEAVARNGGKLLAEYPDQDRGVFFVMQFVLK